MSEIGDISKLDISSTEVGYKYVLTLQLITIAKAASSVKRHGNFKENEGNIYLYESSINTLESLFISYCEADYFEELEKELRVVDDGFKEKQKEGAKYSDKRAMNAERVLARTDTKFKILISLLGKRGLLLAKEEEEVV